MTEPPNVRADPHAVLFDLDDTLFDHRHCARTALESVHDAHDCFRALPFDEFAAAHAALLEELHAGVMLGDLDVDSARRERFRRLFVKAGAPSDDALVDAVTARYRRGYVEARRSVAGAAALLERVQQRARVVVVSNNILAEQRDKLRHCGLDRFVDDLVVSEEVGVAKPHPAIFHAALERARCDRTEAVMLGDSWAADIAGARAAGIRAIWVNPLGIPRPERADDVEEIRSLEPLESILRIIFNTAGQESYARRS